MAELCMPLITHFVSIVHISVYACVCFIFSCNMDFTTKEHKDHAIQWNIPGFEEEVCLACIIELLEEDDVLSIKKQHVLHMFMQVLQRAGSIVMKLLCSDIRVIMHIIGIMFGEDYSYAVL